jgi:hypothetical protein
MPALPIKTKTSGNPINPPLIRTTAIEMMTAMIAITIANLRNRSSPSSTGGVAQIS